MAYLKDLHVIFADELGTLNATTLEAFNLILQALCESPAPFGGKLLVFTGDHLQLRLPGLSVWTSAFVLSGVRVLQLQELVRSAASPDLQEIIRIMRHDRTPSGIDRLCAILRRHPDQFINSFRDAPRHAVCLLARVRAAEAYLEEETRVARERFAAGSSEFACVDAVDRGYYADRRCSSTELVPGVTPFVPTTAVLRSLQNIIVRATKVPLRLSLYRGLIVSCTEVMMGQKAPRLASPCSAEVLARYPSGRYDVMRNQNGIVHSWTTDSLGVVASVIVRMLPTGCEAGSAEAAAAGGPQSVFVSFLRTETQPLEVKGYVLGRSGTPDKVFVLRRQFPLVNSACTTIHSAIGDTLNSVVTRIVDVTSLDGRGRRRVDGAYSLWEVGQLMVLVTRTRRLTDLHWVGGMEETLAAIRSVAKEYAELWGLSSSASLCFTFSFPAVWPLSASP